SIIELFSASVLLWRLRIEASGRADEARVEAVEHRASRLVGYTLYFLVAYVVFNSAYGIFIARRVTDTHESAWGILIGLVAKIGMPILAGCKLRVAARLNFRALRADAIEAIVCGYLSIVLMVGLAATRILGWWWLDSVAAPALIPFLIKEARAAIQGEDACFRSLRIFENRWLNLGHDSKVERSRDRRELVCLAATAFSNAAAGENST